MKYKRRNLEDIYKLKKHENAVFLGCGQTINEITNSQWKTIFKNYDVWTSNNWIYHPTIVPQFYHIELKKYDFDIVKRRLQEKWNLYKNTAFIFDRDSVELAFPEDCQLKYWYKPVKTRKERININANYKMESRNRVNFLYQCSITAILEIMYRFNYKNIILFGVELNNSRYFWSYGDKKVYGEVHHQINKEHEGHKPEDYHNTYLIKDFIIDFNRRWMKPYKKEIFTGTKKTLIYPEIEYKEI